MPVPGRSLPIVPAFCPGFFKGLSDNTLQQHTTTAHHTATSAFEWDKCKSSCLTILVIVFKGHHDIFGAFKAWLHRVRATQSWFWAGERVRERERKREREREKRETSKQIEYSAVELLFKCKKNRFCLLSNLWALFCVDLQFATLFPALWAVDPALRCWGPSTMQMKSGGADRDHLHFL
jgi:hypothetical protein